MLRRWMSLLAAAAVLSALARADSDCLPDGLSCRIDLCPPVCCTGVPMRRTSAIAHCPPVGVVLADPTDTPTAASAIGSSVSETAAPSTASSSLTDSSASSPASSTEGDNNAATTDQTPTPTETTTPAVSTDTPVPTSSFKGTDVDAFQSSSTLSGSRHSGGGATTPVVVGGALAGCVVMVAAVMYKRKNTSEEPLEVPGSSYQGSDNAGLTPDNRSLDGMIGGGARASTADSQQQLPVLSVANHQEAGITRPSSPFGHGSVRISSPAHRASNYDDFAFAVDANSSRGGSTVHVAFVDTSSASNTGNGADVAPETKGVVAL